LAHLTLSEPDALDLVEKLHMMQKWQL